MSTVSVRAEPGVRWWWYVLAGAAYALLTALCLPPFGLWFLTWLAPMPLALAAIVREPRAARMSLLVGLGALPLWLYELTYIGAMTAAGYVPLCVYLSLYSFLFSWLLAVCRKRLSIVPLALLFPVLWVFVELLRCEIVLNGYPWLQLAHGLIESPVLAAPARFGGEYLVSFMVAWVAGSVVDLFASRPRWGRGVAFLAAGLLAFTVLANTSSSAAPAQGRALNAGLIQTNLPQSNKSGWKIEERVRDMARWTELSRRAAGVDPRPDVIVWPETMFPGYFLDEQAVRMLREEGVSLPMRRTDGVMVRVPLADFAQAILGLSLELAVPMVVGGIGVERLRAESEAGGGVSLKFDGRYNSVFLVRDGRIAAPRYDKMALTPMGEYMPVVGRWKWLQDRLLAFGGRGMTFDLKVGTDPVVFEVPTERGTVRLVTPICFETTWATQCRLLVGGGGSRRADVMVCLTNDGWFADSDRGREQHLQAARWRCVELGTPMIRAANTGISAAIDARGRVLKRGVDGQVRATDIDGVLSVSVPIPSGETTYLRHGDLFRWPATCVGSLLALTGLVGEVRDRRLARRQRGSRSD